jgi:hypothetical protein
MDIVQEKEVLLAVWWSLRWAVLGEGRPSRLILAIGGLLAILMRLRLTVTGLPIGKWLRLIWCGTCHRATPRHSTPDVRVW